MEKLKEMTWTDKTTAPRRRRWKNNRHSDMYLVQQAALLNQAEYDDEHLLQRIRRRLLCMYAMNQAATAKIEVGQHYSQIIRRECKFWWDKTLLHSLNYCFKKSDHIFSGIRFGRFIGICRIESLFFFVDNAWIWAHCPHTFIGNAHACAASFIVFSLHFGLLFVYIYSM